MEPLQFVVYTNNEKGASSAVHEIINKETVQISK